MEIQNEMKGVLDRMTADAAWRILDSTSHRAIKSLTEGCMYCSESERGHCEYGEGAQVPQ